MKRCLRIAHPAVLDQLDGWNEADGHHVLAGKLDLDKVGMSGHSFGAVTTQTFSGQRDRDGKARFTDSRIAAALIMSPASPQRATPRVAFGQVSLPWMLMTGTEDTAPIGRQTVEKRLMVYPALPPGEKYELVLSGAEHYAFTERALPGDSPPRNPNHHRTILALSTAFWDAYLLGNSSGQEWLDGEGAQAMVAAADRWQMK